MPWNYAHGFFFDITKIRLAFTPLKNARFGGGKGGICATCYAWCNYDRGSSKGELTDAWGIHRLCLVPLLPARLSWEFEMVLSESLVRPAVWNWRPSCGEDIYLRREWWENFAFVYQCWRLWWWQCPQGRVPVDLAWAVQLFSVAFGCPRLCL